MRKKRVKEENFRKLVKNKIFTEKTFTDCSLVSPPKDAMPPDFMEKIFMNNYKTSKFTKVFSLKSFPLYAMYIIVTISIFTNLS